MPLVGSVLIFSAKEDPLHTANSPSTFHAMKATAPAITAPARGTTFTAAAPVQVPTHGEVGVQDVYETTEPLATVEAVTTAVVPAADHALLPAAVMLVAETVTRVGVTFESSHDRVDA